MVEPCGPIREVVFLVYWPITQVEADKWGFDYLKSEGFGVQVFDVSSFLSGEALRKSPVPAAIGADCIKKIASFREFDDMVKQIAANAVFIDYIMGLSEPDMNTERLFRILKKHGSRYFVISAGALPLPQDVSAGCWASFSFKARRKIKNATNPRRLAGYVSSKLISFLKKYSDLYPVPYRIFSGDSEHCAQYIARYPLCKDRVVTVHSLDYDVYLDYVRQRSLPGESLNGTCVFIDDAMTHHSDFSLLKIKPLTDEEYFPAINRFFEVIERKTGLRVVIAAHPRSRYENMPDVFSGREVVKGKTVDLIAKCSLVVTHMSTAVSFAVLFNKPLLLVQTEEMSRHPVLNRSIRCLAEALGERVINIERPEELSQLSFDFSSSPRTDKYAGYKFRYVMSRTLGELKVWEVVARELHRINAERTCDLSR